MEGKITGDGGMRFGSSGPGLSAGAPPAVVSCEWLREHLGSPGLVVVDVREPEEYDAGHIDGAVSIPFVVPVCTWIAFRDDLLLELPDPEALTEALGRAGIGEDSTVVVVSAVGDPAFPQAAATRVTATLAWIGVSDVRILDGGHPAWVAAGQPVTVEVPTPTPVTGVGRLNPSLFVDIEHVRRRIGAAVLLDARDTAVYSGEVTEPWAGKAGHLPTAVSLPAAEIWRPDGTIRSDSELREQVEAALGEVADAPDREMIVYCGVGGYATAWWTMLTRVLGYTNVTMYDGSVQEWVRYHDLVLDGAGEAPGTQG